MRLLLVILVLLSPSSLFAEPRAEDEASIRATIAAWYDRLRQPERTHWQLYAPGAIDGGPGETEIRPESRARSPTVSNELAARALQFGYDVDDLFVETRLAKVRVWERGYFYAWAAQQTYESAASTLFVMEKQADGRWLILAHEANSVGIPPNRRTEPMPDLAELWKSGAAASQNRPQ